MIVLWKDVTSRDSRINSQGGLLELFLHHFPELLTHIVLVLSAKSQCEFALCLALKGETNRDVTKCVPPSTASTDFQRSLGLPGWVRTAEGPNGL